MFFSPVEANCHYMTPTQTSCTFRRGNPSYVLIYHTFALFDLPEIVGNLNDLQLKPSQPEIGVCVCLWGVFVCGMVYVCVCHFVHGPTLNNTSWCFVGCFSCFVWKSKITSMRFWGRWEINLIFDRDTKDSFFAMLLFLCGHVWNLQPHDYVHVIKKKI